MAILPNILQKEKNEIGLTVYELKTEMWKTFHLKNEITIPKPWNHYLNGGLPAVPNGGLPAVPAWAGTGLESV